MPSSVAHQYAASSKMNESFNGALAATKKLLGLDKTGGALRARTDYELMSAVRVQVPTKDLREEIHLKNKLVQLWEDVLLHDEECYRYGGREPCVMQFQVAKGITPGEFARQFLAANAVYLRHLVSTNSLITALEKFWWERTEQWHRRYKMNSVKAIQDWASFNRLPDDGTPLEPFMIECSYGDYPHLTSVRVVVHRDENDFLDSLDPKEPACIVVATRDCHAECGQRYRDDRRLKAVCFDERKEEIRAVCQSSLARAGDFQGRTGGSAFDWS
jgi:hypothetical protein